MNHERHEKYEKIWRREPQRFLAQPKNLIEDGDFGTDKVLRLAQILNVSITNRNRQLDPLETILFFPEFFLRI